MCTATTRSTPSSTCSTPPGKWSARPASTDAGRALLQAAGRDSPSLKVIADHIRACSFIVADGVIPGNEGRGYVLRRITRRAIRHGYKLGARQPFFHQLVAALVAEMGEAYPELRQQAASASPTCCARKRSASSRRSPTAWKSSNAALAAGAGRIDGEVAFKLHDTYGFPLDLTADVCRERGVSVDTAGFDAAMARQREQARAAGKFKMAAGLEYSRRGDALPWL